MDSIYTVTVIILGFVLRLGIPIAVTALLAWVFRRLDARWEAEAEVERARVEALVAAGAPCWEIHYCTSPQDCPAGADPQSPCWEHFRDRQGNLREGCIGCGVFRNRAPAPLVA